MTHKGVQVVVFAIRARCKVRFCRFGIYGADGDLRRRDLKE